MIKRTSLILLFLTIAAHAAPPTGDILLTSDQTDFKLAGSHARTAALKPITIAGQPFTRGWQVTTHERSQDYEVQLSALLKDPPAKNEVVLLTAYARLIDTADESGEGSVGFVLEQSKEPYNKTFTAKFGVTKDWQRFDIPAIVQENLSKTGAQVTVRLGDHIQTVEVGGISLTRFPANTPLSDLPRTKITYPGREDSAPWRKAAADRIDQLRKAPISITVVDAAGHPVPNAKVDIQMKRHAFVFGSCYAPDYILGIDKNQHDIDEYRAHFIKLFNTATDEFEMKWPYWIKPETRANAMQALAWLDEHHIAVRGHNFIWPAFRKAPPDLSQYADNPTALHDQIRDHILEEGRALKGRVVDWDVVNEPYVNNDITKILGEQSLADWFKYARQADPAAKLYLNETNVPTAPPNDIHYTALYNRIKMIQDAGAPIDGVGMQAHFGGNVVPPDQLLTIYDRFAKLNIPTRITELDIDSSDEDLQADYYRDFLTASFSHPNINGIVLWGFWQDAHWRPNAAMYKKDWTPRPLANVWNNLLFKQWWTTTNGTTSPQGTFTTRAFQGIYEIKITTPTKSTTLTQSLPATGLTTTITLN